MLDQALRTLLRKPFCIPDSILQLVAMSSTRIAESTVVVRDLALGVAARSTNKAWRRRHPVYTKTDWPKSKGRMSNGKNNDHQRLRYPRSGAPEWFTINAGRLHNAPFRASELPGLGVGVRASLRPICVQNKPPQTSR